eukprot:CAMPEP_0118970984 /NCGR_PEP_ID=MMETSP1173-20130426/7747_1 /TAXON_ID=1034831 /ORGANISM="Rhizochromulina marina cf, Strain CCMP1243" /LENGTH=437 /DNA_ID=CAMNT_0006920407 /DNA_START=120 /DNA_END=1433 /DNA_ORIENTATION=-
MVVFLMAGPPLDQQSGYDASSSRGALEFESIEANQQRRGVSVLSSLLGQLLGAGRQPGHTRVVGRSDHESLYQGLEVAQQRALLQRSQRLQETMVPGPSGGDSVAPRTGGGPSGIRATLVAHRPPVAPHSLLYKSWEQWQSAAMPSGDMHSMPAVTSGSDVHHLPFFVIAGAQKGGTTYLRWLLVQHPLLESGYGLHGEKRGEPHFFDWGYLTKLTGSDGVARPHSTVARRYARMFRMPLDKFVATNGSTLFFDTTPAYVVETDTVPKRLTSLLPSIRVIVVFRDPTDRYRSELQMEVCRSRLFLSSMAREYHRHGQMRLYLTEQHPKKPLRRGLYADQLEIWFEFVSRDALLILTSDELYSDPLTTAAKALGFLGLAEVTPTGFTFNLHAPKNAACKKDMSSYLDESELAQLRTFYLEKNRRLPELAPGTVFPWLA